MLFKVNSTTAPVKCDEKLLADVPDMRFGNIGKDRVVIDASFHSSQSLNSTFNETKFMTCNRAWIETLAKSSNLPLSELFYRNTDGHILMVRELAMIYLMWADGNMLVYMVNLLEDALTDGFAISDGLLVSMIHSKVPDRVLETILEARKNEKT